MWLKKKKIQEQRLNVTEITSASRPRYIAPPIKRYNDVAPSHRPDYSPVHSPDKPNRR